MAKVYKTSKQSVATSKKRREKYTKQFAKTTKNLLRKNKTNKKSK